MAGLPWRDAIIKVLTGSEDAVHYAEIAEQINAQGLRTKLGATPAATVNSIISLSLSNEGDASPFVRVKKGHYALRGQQTGASEPKVAQVGASEPGLSPLEPQAGLINAFGMYWRRDTVQWRGQKTKLLGKQPAATTDVDFAAEKGVYLLHDGAQVVYVGRASDQPLGTRLAQHTTDRLNGRWDRFSWFGVYPASETGALNTSDPGPLTITTLVATMEALLIEGLEPRQNRKRGDDFGAVEYLQVVDPEVKKALAQEWIAELLSKA